MAKKLILVGVLSLAVGCIAGGVFAQTRLGSRFAKLTEERDKVSKELSRATADKDKAAQRVGTLEKRNRQLEEETRALREEAEALQADAGAAALGSYAEPAGETVSATETTDEAVAPDNPDIGRRRGRRGAFGEPGEGLSEEERTARRERWETFQQEMRDQRDAFFQKEMDAAPDQDTQDRIEAIREYPANVLAKVGDRLRVTLLFLPTNNANSKTVRIRWTNIGGTTLAGPFSCAANSASSCGVVFDLLRASATGAVITNGVWNTGAGTLTGTYGAVVTPTFTSANTIAVTATTASAAGDLTLIYVSTERVESAPVASLVLDASGDYVRVATAHQQWHLTHVASGDGEGDWWIEKHRIKSGGLWVNALDGVNDTLAYRNGTFIGASHLNMGTPTVSWSLDGRNVTPGLAPQYGDSLVLSQRVTGYLGGVPAVDATFRHELVG